MQFAVIEGLGDVVVSASLETGDDVVFAIECSKQDDIELHLSQHGPGSTADLDAIHFRHHPVENSELRRRASPEDLPGLRTVFGDRHFVPPAL